MRVSQLEGVPVIDTRDRVVGKVARAVFSAEEPVFVGVEVRMRPLLYLFERPRRYVATSVASMKRSGVQVLPGGRVEREGARKSAVDWETAVVWAGQAVVTESGAELGFVGDVEVDSAGRVTRIELTGGATRDVAVGTREVLREHVIGFDGEAVRVLDAARGTEFGGGVAASAGRGTAVAKVTVERAAKVAAKGVVAAGVAAGKAAKRVDVPGRLGGAFKGFAAGVKEGMRDEEEKR